MVRSQTSLRFEQEAWNAGHRRVAGVDEAGRGPLAGPVVAAAVLLPAGFDSSGLDDSKRLSLRRRDELYEQLTSHPSIEWATGETSAARIDSINILEATREAMEMALARLCQRPDFALLDGRPFRSFAFPHRGIVKGDALSCSIAAASIIAKVTRDRLMTALEIQWPGYGFEKHKGYGTRQHLEALDKLGPCPEHRRTFAPVARAALSRRD